MDSRRQQANTQIDLEQRIRSASSALAHSLEYNRENPHPAHLTRLRMEREELIKKINGKYFLFSFFDSHDDRRDRFRGYVEEMTGQYNAKITAGLENLSRSYDRPLQYIDEIQRTVHEAKQKRIPLFANRPLTFESLLGRPLPKQTVDHLRTMSHDLNWKLQDKYITEKEKQVYLERFDQERNKALFGVVRDGYTQSSGIGKAAAIAAGIVLLGVSAYNVSMVSDIISHHNTEYEQNYIRLERVNNPFTEISYDQLAQALEVETLATEHDLMSQERFHLEDVTFQSSIEPIAVERTTDQTTDHTTEQAAPQQVGDLNALRRYLRSTEVRQNPQAGIEALEELVTDTIRNINSGDISIDHLRIADESDFWSLMRVPNFYPSQVQQQLNTLNSPLSYNAMYASLPFINIFNQESYEHGLTNLENYILFPIFITTQESSKGNRFAVSHAAAAGPFQIMPSTGRALGLHIDRDYEQYVSHAVDHLGYRNAKAIIYGLSELASDRGQSLFTMARQVNTIDERVDPIQAAHASMDLHGEHYRRFGSVEKMMVAYNGGNRGISDYERGGVSALRSETRNYVLSYYNITRDLTRGSNYGTIRDLLNLPDQAYDSLLDNYIQYYDQFFMDLVSAYDLNYGQFNGSLNVMFEHYNAAFNELEETIGQGYSDSRTIQDIQEIGDELIERMQYYFHLE